MHLPVQKLDYRHRRVEETEEEVKNVEWGSKSFGKFYSLLLVQMLRVLGLRGSSVRYRQILRCFCDTVDLKNKNKHDTAHPISIKMASRCCCRATVTLLISPYSGRYLLYRTDKVAAAVFIPAS